MKRRVVITGLGVITPVGNNVDEYWNNLKAGKIGFGEITSFDSSEYRAKIVAEVKNFEAKEYIERKKAKRMDRFTQFSIAAAKEAIDDSGLDLEKEDVERIGVIVGTGVGGLGSIEKEAQKLLAKGPNKVSPMFIPKVITNMAAGNIAIQFGLKGVCTNVVTACATSTNTIGDAFRTIQYGDADVMVAGGTESCIVPLGVSGFTALQALSSSEDPAKASRPFDKNRDGFVMGEGSGIVILEELERAKARGAKILAEVKGYGAACDAYHITAPAPGGEGAARAMKLAIKDADIKPEDVSYINAHGTSTEYNDKLETAAIKTVFDEYAYKVPISSTKSMIGHLLGAAGAVEVVACVKTILDGFVHPTVGYTTPDEECDLDYIPVKGRNLDVKYVLSNSLGFGGHNASLIISKYEE
ncbi:beta-ketoacyl-ACP synthase II [Vallitalea guaymasensis]|uniref:3-oxoacyl-[acyl-carrier-protein] synthase 2 n=1 Tax=Vallitalea guaymasensis TaxID=1185412 RepID=A0A8J8SC46_9FIRM|nr:beta-ketoacyl-ACP synthase II [Vallitalea guaymasensis]QUH29438.1 beta-ketoacyl-ACP synthase II [Vallitalea guaymasensis]